MEVSFRYMEFFWLNATMAFMLALTVLRAQPVLLAVIYCGLFGCAPPTRRPLYTAHARNGLHALAR